MTGLSIKTLTRALYRCDQRIANCNCSEMSLYVKKRKRQRAAFIAALLAKSEQMDALEGVVENADRLMRAAEIALIRLAHPEGANWPLLYDVLRSRMYTYTEARDGPEAAQRYGRAAIVPMTLHKDGRND
jgi:hypothetical protein